MLKKRRRSEEERETYTRLSPSPRFSNHRARRDPPSGPSRRPTVDEMCPTGAETPEIRAETLESSGKRGNGKRPRTYFFRRFWTISRLYSIENGVVNVLSRCEGWDLGGEVAGWPAGPGRRSLFGWLPAHFDFSSSPLPAPYHRLIFSAIAIHDLARFFCHTWKEGCSQ